MSGLVEEPRRFNIYTKGVPEEVWRKKWTQEIIWTLSSILAWCLKIIKSKIGKTAI